MFTGGTPFWIVSVAAQPPALLDELRELLDDELLLELLELLDEELLLGLLELLLELGELLLDDLRELDEELLELRELDDGPPELEALLRELDERLLELRELDDGALDVDDALLLDRDELLLELLTRPSTTKLKPTVQCTPLSTPWRISVPTTNSVPTFG
ncbi:MAG: hypothetical protein HYS65_07085 [Betaproteobacteria bacterium]|nr:hypothetical protein [Betaproteobacteria bacterium]MBI2288779.1 hypothetical protein [Betaproteobacteria bacterium]MBI3054332.1 hypothetical protein [Betaproteobacteria bacterium]